MTPSSARPLAPHRIMVEVTPGELLDRISILELRAEHARDPAHLALVLDALAPLQELRREALPLDGVLPALDELARELKRTNDLLWRLRDELRLHEERLDFGPAFVEIARGACREDDVRASLKRRIDELVGSRPAAEKTFLEARPTG